MQAIPVNLASMLRRLGFHPDSRPSLRRPISGLLGQLLLFNGRVSTTAAAFGA